MKFCLPPTRESLFWTQLAFNLAHSNSENQPAHAIASHKLVLVDSLASCGLSWGVRSELGTAQPQLVVYINFGFFQMMEKLGLELIGRNYYDPTAASLVREYCLEVWPGYITSIRQHENSIMLCAEVSNKMIRTDSVWADGSYLSKKTTQLGRKYIASSQFSLANLLSWKLFSC